MLIMEANLHSTIPHLQRLVDLYLPVYQAWKQVEQDAYNGKLKFNDDSSSDTADAEQPNTRQTVPANEPSGATELEVASSQWSA
jgi:hypothetical protein